MTEKKPKSLPLAGAQLIKLRFCGNGKDSEVTIETAGNRTAIISLSPSRSRTPPSMIFQAAATNGRRPFVPTNEGARSVGQ